ncbi:MAG: hypothetical protein WA110_00485 [Anaerolineaceae bacterium]
MPAGIGWNLTPNQVLVVDIHGDKLEGDGEISREARVHFTLLREFYPQATALSIPTSAT